MADEKYRLTLEGSEIDEALLRLANYEDEGLVLGSRKGVMLGPGSEYYHKNARYYAELAQSAVPGDTTSAVRWDIDQSALTDADREMARKNIRAGGSNRNLLDNPWWGSGEVVNQRAVTAKPATNGLYTIDRWKLSSGADANQWAIGANGITFTIASSSIWYMQIIPNISSLFGKTLTASVMFGDGTIKSGTATLTSSASATFWGDTQSNVSLNIAGTFQFTVRTTQTIRAIKLELGSVSTLANDAPPDYGEELAKCQRYFLRLKATGYNYIPVASGVWTSASTVRMLINTPVPMRAVPTISRSGTFKCAGNGTILDVSALDALTITEQGVFANVLTNGSPVAWQYYTLLMLENAYIDLSADL